MEAVTHSPHPIRFFLSALNLWFKLLLLLLGLVCVLAVGWWLYCQHQNEVGRREWTGVKAGLEAKGEKLDWAPFIPKPVPDEENFARTPLLEVVGYRGSLAPRARNLLNAHNAAGLMDYLGEARFGKASDAGGMAGEIRKSLLPGVELTNSSPGALILEWLEPAGETLNELRMAALRPHSQFRVPTNHAFGNPLPDFVFVRSAAMTFAVLAVAQIGEQQAESALQDVRVVIQFANGLASQGTLVTTMIRVALLQLALEPIWDGMHRGVWSDEQLAQIDLWLATINLPAELLQANRAERAGLNMLLQEISSLRDPKLFGPTVLSGSGILQRAESLLWESSPRGWIWQGQAIYNQAIQDYVLTAVDGSSKRVYPDFADANHQAIDALLKESHPRYQLAQLGIPRISRALLTLGETSARIDLCRVAIALERHERATGMLPSHLSTLQPRFLSQLPGDVIGGTPFQYVKESESHYRLWSVGWNQTDDGGIISTSRENGDWVWFSQPVK